MMQDDDNTFIEDTAKRLAFLLKRNLGFEVAHSKPIYDRLSQVIEDEPYVLQKVTLTTGEELIVHVEFRMTDDDNIMKRMQYYHALLGEQYDLPIRQWVIYGGEQPSKMNPTLPPEQQFTGYELIEACNKDTQEFLNANTPEGVVWGMFSGFGGNGAYETITQIVERLRELTDSEQSLEKYIFQLVNLARLRHLTKVTQQVLKDMPINFDIEKDAFYQEGIEKGEQNKVLEIALRMKEAGFATTDIAKATGLTKEQIKKL